MAIEVIDPGIGNLDCWAWTAKCTFDGAARSLLPSHFAQRVGQLFVLARSPPFEIEAGRLAVFEVELAASHAIDARVEVWRLGGGVLGRARRVAERHVLLDMPRRAVVSHCPRRAGRFELRLTAFSSARAAAGPGEIEVRSVRVLRPDAQPPASSEATDTTLPHWGTLKRLLHGLCKRSRRVNSIVSALETRLEREELVSLPQYMSLCPTGQCNALCDFCSVTINRSGIIKRQIAFGDLERLVAPAVNTVRMFGIEGNGEPTLYREFDGLVQSLLSKNAYAYLITNAARLTDEQLSLLMSLESINISLNAATAATHRRVMKLKNFDEIVANIRTLLARRGPGRQHPQISVSFVVNRLNAHETVDFARFAEFDLGVDRVYIRPLSELATDAGAVEDFRDVAPFASDVEDVLEGMAEYLAATADERRAEYHYHPETFRALRTDPLDNPVMPVDEPERLVPPRQAYWSVPPGGAEVAWPSPTEVRLARASEGAGGVLLRSDLVAVPSGREVVLAFVASGSGAAPTVRVVAPDETVVAERPIAFASNGPARETRLAIATGPYRALRIEIADTGAPHATTIGLGRVRRPAPILLSNQPLSRAARWEAGVEGASVHWTDCVQEVRWQGPEFLYLAKSYSQPCLPDTTLVYPARIVVGRGRLGIGVLSEDFSHFIATFAFDAGAHEALLAFPSGANRRFQIVLYAIGSDGVEARVDWSRAMTEVPSPELARPLVPALEVRETGPDRVRSRELRPAPLGAAVAEVAGPPGAAEGRSSGLGRRLREFLMGPPRMYCHKPWTDLHNFTVDGRMDVCCIATGPSQKRYELGNLTTQRFQEVWNGPVAREFRRTVNDPVKALPPCQRCPMARAYQGPYFDPEGTAWQFWALVRLRGLWGVPGFKWLHRMLFAALYGPLHILLFRGFKRADLFPSKALKSWYVER